MRFFSRKDPYKTLFLSCWHDPSAPPLAPIYRRTSVAASNPARVHWWDSETAFVTGASILSPDALSPDAQRLPTCGFFSPSASYVSYDSDNAMPWVTTALNNSSFSLSRFKSLALADDANTKASFKSVRPLKRVLTVTRTVGDAIKKRRKIEKVISPEDLLRGLGLAFCDRSVAPEREEEEEEAGSDGYEAEAEDDAEDDDRGGGRLVVRNLTETISEEDDY